MLGGVQRTSSSVEDGIGSAKEFIGNYRETRRRGTFERIGWSVAIMAHCPVSIFLALPVCIGSIDKLSSGGGYCLISSHEG